MKKSHGRYKGDSLSLFSDVIGMKLNRFGRRDDLDGEILSLKVLFSPVTGCGEF